MAQGAKPPTMASSESSLKSELSEKSTIYDVDSPMQDGGKQHWAVSEKGSDTIEQPFHYGGPDRGSSSQPPFPALKATASNFLTKVESHLTTRSIVDPGPPPDGGLKAWTQCAMAWIAVFNTWGYVNSFGAFQTYYSSTLNESPSTISWIGSIQVCIMFVLGAFSGRALDAGYFIPTFTIGVIIQLIGIFTMSLSTKYWQILLTEGVLTGIGGGIFFTPALALVNTYFSKHRGIAIGITSTGNATGGMVYPLIVRALLPKIGFGWTVRVLGFMQLALLSLVLAFMRPRLPPRKSGPWFEWQHFKDPVYAMFVSGMFFITGPLYFTFYYIASYGRDAMGLSYSHSVTLLILLNGIGIASRLPPGFVADRWLGPLNIFIPLLYFNALILFCWLAVSSKASFYVFTCFYGLAAAAFQSLFPVAIASLSTDLSNMGTRLGMSFAVMGLASLTGPPIGGALLSTDGGGYVPVQIWAGTSTLFGAGLITAARIKRYGWNWKIRC